MTSRRGNNELRATVLNIHTEPISGHHNNTDAEITIEKNTFKKAPIKQQQNQKHATLSAGRSELEDDTYRQGINNTNITTTATTTTTTKMYHCTGHTQTLN